MACEWCAPAHQVFALELAEIHEEMLIVEQVLLELLDDHVT